MGVTGPKKASRMAWALAAPLATIRTFRACMMSRTPMVRAWVGTSLQAGKKRRLACRVLSVSSTWWVPREKASAGSLKPMWPLTPRPSSCRSMPPRSRMIWS